MSTNYDVDELLDELGSGLRADVLLYMDRHLISKIPFFENKVRINEEPYLVLYQNSYNLLQPRSLSTGPTVCC
jgi:hypothetical protein